MLDQQSHLSVNWIEETVLAVRLYVYIIIIIQVHHQSILELHYNCSFVHEPLPFFN